MENKIKHFILNKEMDYEKGRLKNLQIQNHTLAIKEYGGYETYFISGIYDSKENDTIWHRTVIESLPFNSLQSVSIYSTNSLTREVNGKIVDLEEIIYAEYSSLGEVKASIKPYLKKTIYRSKDFLLHDVVGRYLWFILEFQADAEELGIDSIRIYFPKHTWLGYLPEVYSSNRGSAEFLERFLGIYQSLYEDLNEKIRYSPAYFFPQACEKDLLPVIAKLLGENMYYIWNEDQLRYLLSHAMEWNGFRGTVKSLLNIVELYTGERPYIVEHQQLTEERIGSRKEIILSLYGDNPSSFTLVVKEKQVPSNKEYKTLVKILEEVKPAHMDCKIIVIRPYIFLNSYSYMGMNSMLGKYKPFDLKEVVIMPFATVSNKEEGV